MNTQKPEVFEYYAEHHNYDIILRSTHTLLMYGQAVKDPKVEFSFLSASMLLSFCAIESFLNSIAFLLDRNKKENFDFEKYSSNESSVEDRLEMICGAANIEVDKSQGKFQGFKRMQKWRNSLVHSKPSSVGVLNLYANNGRVGPLENQKAIGKYPYENFVTVKEAEIFYQTAFDIIEEIKTATNYDPRATCSYKKIEEEGSDALEEIKEVVRKTQKIKK